MKRTMTTLAILAASGAASAQSSVTLFGVADVGYQYGSGSVSDRHGIGNSGLASSRFGFRGVEDLGGGLKASFWLEGGFAVDTGSSAQNTNTNNQTTGAVAGGGLMFGRRATVSLSGPWGEVRAGRDRVAEFWNLVDAFDLTGIGTSLMATNIITGPAFQRASNLITYYLPTSSTGLFGQVSYHMGENLKGTPTEDDGNGRGLRLGYRAGNFSIAGAYGQKDFAAGDAVQSNIKVDYRFGTTLVMAQISRDERGTVDGRGWNIGAIVPVTSGRFLLGLSNYRTTAAGNPSARKLAVGYSHDLSKRTALYGVVATVRNRGGSTTALNGAVTGPNDSSTGVSLGIRHSF